MQVSNNISSFNVWKNYTNNVSSLRDSMSKLSSGSRINNAGDDPSGLAMSERLRTQSRNTAAAAGNVENKLNYLQTADSWMQKMHDMLGRMGELAVMSNDGTKSQVDRDILQKEFSQMQEEIVRIADDAGKFNGNALFDGTTISQQVGADGGQTFDGVSIDLQSTTATDLDGATGAGTTTWADLIDGTVNISTAAAAEAAVGDLQLGVDFISNKRADVGAEMKRMDQTLDGLRSYEENISATESRIRDVDVAKETAEMSKYNILQQVGTAMLAQANQLPQGVLQLLG
ncbi:flagellin [Pontiella agarivorans]|uniref:Flagellin n=1 Tax=Pontiella agarivorans TaxID=3038953 RepID=A0ABU5MSR3_9BACT|nr:flagellin [Pontiella agarivorans]MDZ8117246.1 flagellin [Pontiella agarivorans]